MREQRFRDDGFRQGRIWDLDLSACFPDETDISELFIRLTAILQKEIPIRKGLLAVRGVGSTHFVATATVGERKTRRNLSLVLPRVSSLFEKVAETGTTYTEACVEFFSGNSFEKNLLLDDNSNSFVLVPLRHEAHTVAIMGYSSDEPTAFALFEEELLAKIVPQLSARIAASMSPPAAR
ncbi:MAG: hypothetical protein JSU65_01770 [Candidatus Zixiibacteriota bacterium]|nr:MAG: hypothetical protein JSU65_01770 [candidate division Zixibacteria bacterium]